jgi:hypothetical protein
MTIRKQQTVWAATTSVSAIVFVFGAPRASAGSDCSAAPPEIDVTVEFAPTLASTENLSRCIEFSIYSNCVDAPVVVAQDLLFGPPANPVGRATAVVPVPPGQYVCVQARDPLHTLRSSADLVCENGRWAAYFTGDALPSPTWLIGGNANGDSVIDILDFGNLVGSYLRPVDPHTTCSDLMDPFFSDVNINGDGVTDVMDFSFMVLYFLEDDKDAVCCPEGGGPSGGGKGDVRPAVEDGQPLQAPVPPATAQAPLVSLELRLPLSSSMIACGEEVAVELLAYSPGPVGEEITAIDAILSWDPTRLVLLGISDPCTPPGGCPPDTYDWLSSSFPNDCNLDGLNNPCAGLPANDGLVFYSALRKLPPDPPALSSDGGLLVTTFRFQPLTEGVTQLQILPASGVYTRSRVVGSSVPGVEVTGSNAHQLNVAVSNFCDDDNACTCNKCVSSVCDFAQMVEFGNVNCSPAIAGHPGGVVDLDDVLCVLDGFENFAYCPSGDIAPDCVGNDLITIDDLLGVLNAYTGGDPCGCPP